MSQLLQQLEQRMAELRAQYGSERRHPLTPFSPFPRGSGQRRDVSKKLGLPMVFDAHRATGDAFKGRTGSYAHLLVGKTAEVVEAFMFSGMPGIRAALVDLAAFALVLADTFDAPPPSPSTSPRSTS